MAAQGRMIRFLPNDPDDPQCAALTLELAAECAEFSAGTAFCAVLTPSGEVLCAGENRAGQLGRRGVDSCDALLPAHLPWPACSIGCGSHFTSAVRTGGSAICVWGWIDYNPYEVPVELPLPTRDPIAVLAVGMSYLIVLTVADEAFGMGQNGCGELALGQPTRMIRELVRIPALSGRGIRKIACGDSFGIAETSGGELLGWGRGGSYWANTRGINFRAQPEALPGAGAGIRFPLQELTASGPRAAAVDAAGAAWLWEWMEDCHVTPGRARPPTAEPGPLGARAAEERVASPGGQGVRGK
eukprot:TRINITY_DN18512_c0_g1_i2.p2 TRINITY_DN18512_c0_g1~~TRINITY_DN18512_c0_g1_i2.p2  ORF type:complete len:323 (+),score=72.11 TRINITY_DN18512_c0_g1_i2:71-970(+)